MGVRGEHGVSTACGSGRVSCLDDTRPLPQAVLTCTLNGGVN